MTAADVFAAAAADIYASAGHGATFTPAAGSAVGCHVDIQFNVQLQPDGYQSQVTESATVIEAALAELTQLPLRGDTFTVGAVTYTVDALLENDGYVVKVSVK